MRFFIALEIPDDSQQQLETVQIKLKQLIPEVRLTNPEKLHLTLAFIGEQPESLLPKLIEIIKQAVTGISRFELTPAYIDGFPNIHHPHTFWIGVKGDIEKLLLIRERIKDGLASLNLVVDERRFTPHIAIGKIKDFQMDARTENALAGLMAQNFDPIKITSIKLFESIPEEGFHSHNTLAEVKLDN